VIGRSTCIAFPSLVLEIPLPLGAMTAPSRLFASLPTAKSLAPPVRSSLRRPVPGADVALDPNGPFSQNTYRSV